MERSRGAEEEGKGGRVPPKGLDPLIFHVSNIVLHAVVSALVCWWVLKDGACSYLIQCCLDGGAASPSCHTTHQFPALHRLSFYLFRKRARLVRPASRGPLTPGSGEAPPPLAPPSPGIGSPSAAPPDVGEPASAAGLRRRVAGASAVVSQVGLSRIIIHLIGRRIAGIRGMFFIFILHFTLHIIFPQVTSGAPQHDKRPRSLDGDEDLSDTRQRSELTQVYLPSLLTSLAFALHPVHTEAVAGIVGHAELLCAALSIPALLLYFTAVDAPSAGGGGTSRLRGRENAGGCRHWALVAAALVFTWAAALSKEIGITVLGTMMVYDLLLVPLDHPAGPAGPKREEEPKQRAGWAKGESAPFSMRSLVRQRKWARMAVLCVTGILYVKARSYVAGDQLVRIYRKVGPVLPSLACTAISGL